MSLIGYQVRRFQRSLPVARARLATLLRSRPRAGYIGWHSNGNLGDDAMFEAICRLLPVHDLVTFAAPDQESYLGHFHLSGKRYFDAVILGGGTLINPDWQPPVREALREQVPLYTFGTGVGSCGFEQPDGVEITGWKDLLPAFHRIGVRGPRSKRSLEALGIRNVEVVGDLALSLTPTRSIPAATDPPRVALNIAMPAAQDYEADANAFLRDVAQAIRDLSSRGWRVVPFAMAPSDVRPVERFLHEVGIEALPVPVLATACQFFEIVGPCTFTIAVRLHGAILSTCVGVPPLMLGYRDKCLDFMESVNLAEWHVSLGGSGDKDIPDKAAALSAMAPTLRAPVFARAEHWKRVLHQYAHSCFGAEAP